MQDYSSTNKFCACLQETKIASFVADCNARIAAHEAEYNKWASVIPFEQMTLEEYATSFPDQVSAFARFLVGLASNGSISVFL